MIFLQLEQILDAHADQVAKFGGEPNIRDMGLLQSAAAMPETRFGGEYLHEFPHGMAAAYLFHLCANHPFVDGNKRTALSAALMFLELNQFRLVAEHGLVFSLVVDVAAGRLDKTAATEFFRKYVKSA